MKNLADTLKAAQLLREGAEKKLKVKTFKSKSSLTEVEAMKLNHELEVHQIELEMQNGQLSSAIVQTDITTKKHIEFYDFLPLAYCNH